MDPRVKPEDDGVLFVPPAQKQPKKLTAPDTKNPAYFFLAGPSSKPT
jgi:hypothetical protein